MTAKAELNMTRQQEISHRADVWGIMILGHQVPAREINPGRMVFIKALVGEGRLGKDDGGADTQEPLYLPADLMDREVKNPRVLRRDEEKQESFGLLVELKLHGYNNGATFTPAEKEALVRMKTANRDQENYQKDRRDEDVITVFALTYHKGPKTKGFSKRR